MPAVLYVFEGHSTTMGSCDVFHCFVARKYTLQASMDGIDLFHIDGRFTFLGRGEGNPSCKDISEKGNWSFESKKEVKRAQS